MRKQKGYPARERCLKSLWLSAIQGKLCPNAGSFTLSACLMEHVLLHIDSFMFHHHTIMDLNVPGKPI